MNSTVISGTPRTNSMKIIENTLAPAACSNAGRAPSRMPNGSDTTMPTADTTTVTSTPPHSEVSTFGRADGRASHAAE